MRSVLLAVLCSVSLSAQAQTGGADGSPASADASAGSRTADVRPQTHYPALLADSYIGVSVGRIGYRFSSRQLEPGFSAAGVEIPNLSARVALFGHRFGPHLSAELVYMRPTNWVQYQDVGGQPSSHSVWMTVAGGTIRPTLPLSNRVSVFAQGGLGIITRRGFAVGNTPVVRSQVSGAVLFGGGVDYHLTRRWDLTADLLAARSMSDPIQPATTNVSTGFRYTMRPASLEATAAIDRPGVIFPARQLQVEYSHMRLGYRMNDLFVKRVPIFWGGNVELAQGFALHVVRNVMHTPKVFALDVGLSAGAWSGRAPGSRFVTLSAYPVARFTFLRTRPTDLYFMYSAAGPSYISMSVVDGKKVGRGFTFQDFLGFGAFLGARRNFSAQVKITHYSNGNLLTENAGVKVPLTLSLGYGF